MRRRGPGSVVGGFRDSDLQNRGASRTKRGNLAEDDEQAVGYGPHDGLPMRGEDRLKQERIAEQREHGTGIRERIEPVGDGALEAARVPCLQQRTGGGKQEIGYADFGGEQRDDSPGWVGEWRG